MSPEELEFAKQVAAEARKIKPDITDDEVLQHAQKMIAQRRSKPANKLSPLPSFDRQKLDVEAAKMPQQTPRQVVDAVRQAGFQKENEQKILGRLDRKDGPFKTYEKVLEARKIVGAKEERQPINYKGKPRELVDYKGATADKAIGAVEALAKGVGTIGNLTRYAMQPDWDNQLSDVVTGTAKKEVPVSGIGDLIKKAYEGEIGSAGEFDERNKRAVERKGFFEEPVAHLYKGAGDVVQAAAESGLPGPEEMQKFEELSAEEQRREKELRKGGAKFARTMAVDALSDPLTFTSFGLKGGAGTIGKQVDEVMKLSGASAQVAQRVNKLAQKIYLTRQGPAIGRDLKRVLKAGGANDRAINQVLGKNLDYAGRSGLSFAGVEAADVARKAGLGKLGVPEQAIRRAIEPIAKPFRAGTHAERIFEKGEVLRAKHKASNASADIFADYEKNVAPLMPADKGQREQLVKFAMDPESAHRQISNLTATEQKAVNALSQFNDRLGRRYLDKGVISELDANPLTGQYVPRLWEKQPQTVGEKLKKAFVTDEHPRLSSSAARSAEKQFPLGADRPGYTAPADPHEIVSKYVPAMERQVASKQFQDAMKKVYGGNVPERAQKLFDNAFSGSRIKILDGLMDLFKSQQLFGAPRFHLANTLEETAKSATAGLISEADDFRVVKALGDVNVADGDIVLKTPAKNYTAGELRRHAKDNGFFASSQTRDFQSARDATRAFNQASDRGAGIGAIRRSARRAKEQPLATASQAFQDVTNVGLNRAGRKYAEFLDENLKTAGFVGRLRQGDNVESAVNRVKQAHFDYADQPRALKAAKRIVPFAGFTYNTGKNLPGLIARNPKIAALQSTFMEQLGADRRDEPPAFQQEQGQTLELGSGTQSAISELFQKAGAPIDPAYRLSYRPRGLLLEGLAQPLEALRGNLGPAETMMGPLVQPLAESFKGRDLLTDREQGPLSFSNSFPLFPAGSEISPPSLEAGVGDAHLLKYAAPFFGPWAVQVANAAAQSPDTISPPFGGAPYSEDTPQRQLLSLLGLLGFPMSLTTPATGFENAADQPAFQRAAGVPKELSSEAVRQEKRKKK